MEGLGKDFNAIPVASGAVISLRNAGGVTFLCSGAGTATVTASATPGGTYSSPGGVIRTVYTNTATDGTARWVKNTPAASNAYTAASGAYAFYVSDDSLPDGVGYVKCTVSAGTCVAILNDLDVQRGPANLPALNV